MSGPRTGALGGRLGSLVQPSRRPGQLRRFSRSGLLATTLIAIGSYGAGALPANDPTRRIPVLGLLRHGWLGLHVALGLYYLGLLLLVITWLLLGRLLLTGPGETADAAATRGDDVGALAMTSTDEVGAAATRGAEVAAAGEVVDPATLRRMFGRWILPLLAAMPLASMDLYSYAAQAQLAKHGYDVYTATPADLPGKFLDNVAWKWVDTPSPYGPLWVAVSRWAAALTGNHALISVLLLRLLPCGSLLIIATLLPRLARQFGGRADLALWLAVANPLVVLHAAGGGHNDEVMLCFLLAGISMVVRPGAGPRQLAAAAALTTLAAAVKIPGAIAIAFIVPLYFAFRPPARRADWVRACLGVALVAAPVFAAVSVIAGVGLGWTKQVNPSVPVINFMSIPTLIAVAYKSVIGAAHPASVVDHTVRAIRSVGSVFSAVLLTVLWFRATKHSAIKLLALGLFTTVLLSPAVQPWYYLWSVTIVATFLRRPVQVYWVAAASVALTFFTLPMGSALELGPFIPAAIAAVLAVRALLGPLAQRRPTSSPPPRGVLLDAPRQPSRTR